MLRSDNAELLEKENVRQRVLAQQSSPSHRLYQCTRDLSSGCLPPRVKHPSYVHKKSSFPTSTEPNPVGKNLRGPKRGYGKLETMQQIVS